ncbi:MAG TPA: lamin tail domain-containing protein [Patescibacteria group bacterium]|nr:lamin tail domain-containing protein [Patescibacteria group bacterium]
MVKAIQYFISGLCAILVVIYPVIARAEDAPAQLVPVIITELQPGSSESASQEFIELYNTTDQPIDFGSHQWRLILAGASAKNWDTPYRTINLSGTIDPGKSYIVASKYTVNNQEVKYLAGQAAVWFSAGMSASGGHLRLVYSTNKLAEDNSCGAVDSVVDEVEWSGTTNGQATVPSLDGRTVSTSSNSVGILASTSLQRLIDQNNRAYVDVNNDATDFTAATPTPGLKNISAIITDTGVLPVVGLPVDTCDPNSPPPTDSGTDTPDTSDPEPAPSDPGSDVADDPEEANSDPNANLPTPLITELLPNPASPQTDADDEFIELYNPGNEPYDLSGFVLESGETTLHRYTFPVGTMLEPHTYTAFYSVVTEVKLSNTSGQVRLFNKAGTLVGKTDVYGTAADGQAWALVDGSWQWTTSLTPGAANKLVAPAKKSTTTTSAATKKTSTTTAKKSTAAAKTTKTAATKKATASKKQASSTKQTSAVVTARSPLNPGVLAMVGAFALLYGAYEYRNDMANNFRKLRDYRAARRTSRQSIARR